MQVVRSLAESRGLEGCAVAIGNFDGVHLGHQRLFELTRKRAARRRVRSAVLTFDPHPARVLRPQLAPPLLTPLPRKLELIAGCGIDAAVVQPFDAAFARTSAAAFVERDLEGRLGAVEVVVGYDFTAGHERARVEALRQLLRARGMKLNVVEPVTADGLTVSSTKIREFLLEGKVEAAALLLTRSYDLDATVERGAGRGRALGFPTANLRTEAMLPAVGVYAVQALVGVKAGEDGVPGTRDAARHSGVCNVGVKPTVQADGEVAAEVHLMDFDGRDLYGERLRVSFVHRLRDERRFPSIDALRAQIARDVEAAREALRRGDVTGANDVGLSARFPLQ
jgi:riboflavin kinase/FMN adenylyltransferase